MHKPESVLENETHKICWDFKIQTDPSILKTRPSFIKQEEKNLLFSEF